MGTLLTREREHTNLPRRRPRSLTLSPGWGEHSLPRIRFHFWSASYDALVIHALSSVHAAALFASLAWQDFAWHCDLIMTHTLLVIVTYFQHEIVLCKLFLELLLNFQIVLNWIFCYTIEHRCCSVAWLLLFANTQFYVWETFDWWTAIVVVSFHCYDIYIRSSVALLLMC